MKVARLRLKAYKGFNDFTLQFGVKSAILVGPNNAGKTTIIAALRMCSNLIGFAMRRNLTEPHFDESRDRRVRGQGFDADKAGISVENIRYEFRNVESRVELHFEGGAAIYVVFPVDATPFFYLEHSPGLQLTSASHVRAKFPEIGIVPSIVPIETRETPLSASHVRANIHNSRLASRHFRNQLGLVRKAEPHLYLDMIDFLLENTPEIDSLELVEGEDLNLFFSESGSRSERELCWVGDGMQVWLQILFHLWMFRGRTVVVLDEPEVFLHPDLQRRLVRVLEGLDVQFILATHSSEVLAEASRKSVVIVDRRRRGSKRVDDDGVLSVLNSSLGSAFNLKLARSLRSRIALFVEGQDMKLLRNFAKTLGANRFYGEIDLTVASLGGAANRSHARSFGWLNQNVLGEAVAVWVALDRDYLSSDNVQHIVDEFAAEKVRCHVWHRKELESYVLADTAIARLSGASVEFVEDEILNIVSRMRYAVFARRLESRNSFEKTVTKGFVTAVETFSPEFESMWADGDWALAACPAKDVISQMNVALTRAGFTNVNALLLSRVMTAAEIPDEMRDFIWEIERGLL